MLVAMFNQKRYAEMETLARRMAERYPGLGMGWKALGTALLQQGRSEEALMPLRKATGLSQGDPQPHNNLGSALLKLNRLSEAEASYRRALELKPDSAEAHYNLGDALDGQNRLPEAEASYRCALEANPNFAEAHNNLGNMLLKQGRLHEAEAAYRRALELKPAFAEAHNNLGNTLLKLDRLSEAEASYRRALELKPDYAEAHYNLGDFLCKQSRFLEAEASLRRTVEFKPNYAEAHIGLGLVFRGIGKLDDAVASYRRALEIKHDFAEAYEGLGNALQDLGKLDDAVASFRRALEIKPDFVEAHDSLGFTLRHLGKIDEAVASYRRALEIEPDFAMVQGNLLYTCSLLPGQHAAPMLAEARRYGELVLRQARPHAAWRNVPDPGRRLRVGLVSGDLCAHPVGYFLENVLAALSAHAAGSLEFFAYSNHSRTDAVTGRIKASCRGWHQAERLSDEALARRIHDDGTDILLDLSGHTDHNRLPVFAWKPAPVQAAWLGYWATTGVAAVDYLIADPWTLPETEEIYFTEKIWRLPETRLCFTPPDADVAVAPLPALANGRITFGCFNNLSKLNDAVVALWARVLATVPGSRLFLKAKQLDEAGVRQSIAERFAAHGIGAGRLLLEGFELRAKYLAAYHRVDIALDPFPFTGATTSAEGLWMGVPVLTLAGDSFLSRQGVGLLMNAGLPEWIAANADDYVARAASHAGDPQRLAALRGGLRRQALASPIFDAPRFARHFEAALRGMWARWCIQQQGKTL